MGIDELAEWVEDLNSQDPKRINAARRATEPGSVADGYAAYRLHSANSNIDGGYPQDAHKVTAAGNSVQSCPGDDSPCATLGDFEQVNGKVAGFTVNGRSLMKRLALGPGKPVPVLGLATVRFLSAYKTVTDDSLLVAVKLTAGAEPLTIIDGSYRAPNGRQSQAENISGPVDLGARSSATYTLAFPAAVLGGAASLRFYTNGAPIPATVDVPVR